MRRLYSLLIASAVAVCLAGCTKEQAGDNAISSGKEVILCGTMGDCEIGGSGSGSDATGTRTWLFNTKELWWAKGDEIAVYSNNSTDADKFIVDIPNGESFAKTAYFKGTLSQTGDKYYVLYPYSSASEFYHDSSSASVKMELETNQFAKPDGFMGSSMGMYGTFTGSSNDFTMKCLCGGLKFRLNRDDIIRVEFQGNNGEYIAGHLRVNNLDSPEPKVSCVGAYLGQNPRIVTLKRSTSRLTPNVDYFIILAPTSLTKGFTVTLTTADNQKFIVRSNKPQTIKAGVFGELSKPLDEYAHKDCDSVDMGEVTIKGVTKHIKWATCNIGADNPWDYGDYFAWGETQPYYKPGHALDEICTDWFDGKTGYNWESYSFIQKGQSDYHYITKYTFPDNDKPSLWYDGTTYIGDDMRSFADCQYDDDAARQLWGIDWRIPTADEWKALHNGLKYDWEWKTDYMGSGKNGMLVTRTEGSCAGNSIFLPAAGLRVEYYNNYINLDDHTSTDGFYWSSSIQITETAYSIRFSYYDWNDTYGVNDDINPRYMGFLLRPVRD